MNVSSGTLGGLADSIDDGLVGVLLLLAQYFNEPEPNEHVAIDLDRLHTNVCSVTHLQTLSIHRLGKLPVI